MADKKFSTWYDFCLPLFKQGDDLAQYLEIFKSEGRAAAFMALAEQYENASKLCKRMASVIKEAKTEVEVCASGHTIEVGGDPKDFEGLISDAVLQKVGLEEGDEDEIDLEVDEDDLEIW